MTILVESSLHPSIRAATPLPPGASTFAIACHGRDNPARSDASNPGDLASPFQSEDVSIRSNGRRLNLYELRFRFAPSVYPSAASAFDVTSASSLKEQLQVGKTTAEFGVCEPQ